jgi:hypothetical protein
MPVLAWQTPEAQSSPPSERTQLELQRVPWQTGTLAGQSEERVQKPQAKKSESQPGAMAGHSLGERQATQVLPASMSSRQ